MESLLAEPRPDEAEDKEDHPKVVEQRIDASHNK
jgi:hypothetical protein